MTPKITVTVDPPICSVAENSTSLSVLLECELPPRRTPPRLSLTVIQIGADLGLTDALQSRFETDDVQWFGFDDIQIDSVAEALELAIDTGGDRVLLLVGVPLSEAIDRLVDATEAIRHMALPADVLCFRPAADVALLRRLVDFGGGQVLIPNGDPLGVLDAHLSCLRESAADQATLSLTLNQGLQPGFLYRVTPNPRFLGPIRTESSELGVFKVNLGPLPTHSSLLFQVVAPRRKAGCYRLADVTLDAEREGEHWSVDQIVVHHCSVEPSDAMWVEAAVVAARTHVEPAALIDELSRAYTAGDARRVSVMLERLVRQFLALNNTDATEHVYATRMQFLRTGILARAELNTLRGLVK